MAEFNEVAALTDSVKEQVAEGAGMWAPCSGCHETVDGYSPTPSSAIFGCPLGSGCSECGGIGAVWDDTDYADMANWMAEQDRQAAALPESLAQWLHDETGHPDSYPNHTWPETERDDGQREGGFVKIVPLHAQAQFRDIAKRLIGRFSLRSDGQTEDK